MESRDVVRFRQQMGQVRRILEVPGRDLAGMSVPGSNWSAAAQLDHTLKVATAILSILEKDEPALIPKGINLLGHVILTLGWIPRGKAKSPKKLQGEEATPQELLAQLATVEASLARVTARVCGNAGKPIVPHPIFGGMTRKQALRLLAMHTGHHLKIVGPLEG